MEGKEKFKEFVKKNPSLINHVKDGKSTWQNFYDIYSLYGEEGSHWDEYIKKNDNRSSNVTNNVSTSALGGFFSNITFKDVFGYLKSIDLDNLKANIETVQKGIGMFQDFSKNRTTSNVARNGLGTNFYQPRARGRFFDD